MYIPIKLSLIGVFLIYFFNACSPSEEQASDFSEDGQTLSEEIGMIVEEAWARPASEGRVSAAYFTIKNNSSIVDTLLSVSSDIAGLVEIHESFEQEGGMMGMRDAGSLEILAGQTVNLEPGGFHVMLIQLNKQLNEGDEFDLTLHFAQQGDQTISIAAKQK